MARSYTTVFFDLDGTLLPMDTDVFMKRYFKALGAFAAENGLDSDMCLGAVMAGVKAMAKSGRKRHQPRRVLEGVHEGDRP